MPLAIEDTTACHSCRFLQIHPAFLFAFGVTSSGPTLFRGDQSSTFSGKTTAKLLTSVARFEAHLRHLPLPFATCLISAIHSKPHLHCQRAFALAFGAPHRVMWCSEATKFSSSLAVRPLNYMLMTLFLAFNDCLSSFQ